MAMIKCSECGKDISDKATACIGCGAPIAVSSSGFGDANGDGKVDFSDFKAAFGKLKNKAATAAEDVVNMGKEVLKSKAEKDADGVEKLAQEFGDQQPTEQTEPQIKCDKFKAALESTIDLKFAQVLQSKPDAEKFLNYVDAQILTASVRNIFKSVLAFTPPQVDAACLLSEAILAPSTQEKINRIKAAIGLGGGTTGIALVIGGVAAALGWGTTMYASFLAIFTATSMTGPGMIVAGVTLAAIAGYFATTSNKQTDSERFINVLKSATVKAVDAIWEQYGDELSKAVGNGNSAS